MSFHEDLAVGLRVEQECLAIVRRSSPCAVSINGFKGYDIWVPQKHLSIEVKADFLSRKTGRWLIEVEMNGKPSGLSTSTADIWMFYDGDEWMYIRRNLLHINILTGGYKLVTVTGRGDKNSKNGYFIPDKTMRHICKKVP